MNRSIVLKSRPQGDMSSENFEILDAPVRDPVDGEIVIKLTYLSIDPYLRGKMNDGASYTEPFAIGGVIENSCIGQVTASRNSGFQEGDWVKGFLPWQDIILLGQSEIEGRGVKKIIAQDGVPLSWHLGILGMPGQTAWVGLKGLGKPQAGETVFVSAASGAVGMTVGQIAKQFDCRVVGCAGSDDKVAHVIDEIGFDAAFNYKTETDLDAAFKRCCPEGIDINYENVGGDISLAAFDNLNDFGRMLICGLISRYQSSDPQPGPALMNMLVRRIKVQGFIVSDHPKLCDEWLEVGGQWVREGKLKYHESIKDGLENAPEALMDVLAGRNFGKQIVKV